MAYCMNFYLNWSRNYTQSNLEACFLLSKYQSSSFNHAQVVSMPVEIEVHAVPHFKALVNDKKGCQGLKGAGIFTW